MRWRCADAWPNGGVDGLLCSKYPVLAVRSSISCDFCIFHYLAEVGRVSICLSPDVAAMTFVFMLQVDREPGLITGHA